MNRRKALIGMGLTAFSTVARSLTRPLTRTWMFLPTMEQAAAAPESVSEKAVEERLRSDLAALKPLVYSEEGIPMFLACENLVPPASGDPVKVMLTPTNAALASAFRRDAEAWESMHPHAKRSDVAKLIELLARRDFTSGGKGEL